MTSQTSAAERRRIDRKNEAIKGMQHVTFGSSDCECEFGSYVSP